MLEDVLGALLGDAVGEAVAGSWGDRLRDRRAARRVGDGEYVVAVRVLDGTVAGLQRRRRRGRLRLADGLLTFTPRSWPLRHRVPVPLPGLRLERTDRPGVPANGRVVLAHLPGAVLELLVLAGLSYLRVQLRQAATAAARPRGR